MKVLILLYDSPTYDTRAMQQRRTLQKAGYDVTNVFINPRVVRATMDILQPNNVWIKKQTLNFNRFRNFDIIHAHFIAGLALANRINKDHHAKIVYDMLEFWEDMGSTLVQNKPVYVPFLDTISRIFVEGRPMYDYCRYDIPESIPIDIIHNTKPLKYINYRKPHNKKFTILFLGCISESRFIRETIEVVEECNNVKLILGGTVQGDSYYRSVVEQAKRANNTDWIGETHCRNVIPMTRKADCVVCMINANNFNNQLSLANKQFEAMVAGRPIICSNNTYSGHITTAYGTGIVVPHSKTGLRGAIAQLTNSNDICKTYGKNALRLAKNKFNWKIDGNIMLKAYGEM